MAGREKERKREATRWWVAEERKGKDVEPKKKEKGTRFADSPSGGERHVGFSGSFGSVSRFFYREFGDAAFGMRICLGEREAEDFPRRRGEQREEGTRGSVEDVDQTEPRLRKKTKGLQAQVC